MVNYDWPGNIRALRHSIERAVILSESVQFEPQDFQISTDSTTPARSHSDVEAALDPGTELNLEKLEKRAIAQALGRNRYNISHTAKDLGLTRAALYRRMEKHGL